MKRLLLGLFLALVTGTAVAQTQATVTCAATTTPLLAANAATQFLLIQNPTVTTVWINFAGVAAVAASPSMSLASGQWVSWQAKDYIPSAAINCIATTGTAAVTLVYK